MTRKSTLRAIDKYQKENIKRVVLKLNKKTDKDIIDHLDQQEKVNTYLKKIIRDKIKG